MFGIELQTSGNLFREGVQDREIAYRHSTGLVKIEGDETTAKDAESELEFVTAACSDIGTAQKAIELARTLATKLLSKADTNGLMHFEENQEFEGGKWLKGCTIKIGDPGFAAQPQGTVGVPLKKLREFIEKVLSDDGREDSKRCLADLAAARENCGLDLGKLSPELAGFLTACHIFLINATWNYMPGVVLINGKPGNQDKTPRMWRVCTIPGDYTQAFQYLQTVKYTDAENRNFELSPEDGVYHLLVNRDSPKSMFKLLHRTDFYSMFHALPPADQESLHTASGKGVPPMIWPEKWASHRQLFVYPYRADPHDPAAIATGLVGKCRADGWAGTSVTAGDWLLAAHGPTLEQWWDSVRHGQKTGAGIIPKDLASPPPGIRGRDPAKLSKFPDDNESKREYYGMGAFPMDARGEPPLAVYEHRAFADHPEVAKLGKLNINTWASLVEIFYRNFVPGV